MRSVVGVVVIAVVSACASGHAAVPRVDERTTFYSSGIPASRGFFVGLRKVGHHEWWWPNGTLRTSANYSNDAFEGEYRTWRRNGHPYELRHYRHGREEGLQQSWNDDGSLYLNYEVRNGRRYGFINAAPCLPADENGQSKAVTP